ncbi:O-antigen ligase family protein [Leptolyngbya sp. AN02str]|uniref:O-antigen ligase family protein n=1 Tax=Leptolyngbya sp. AN02str TaxID=3423363 RepID=UPI003D31DD60
MLKGDRQQSTRLLLVASVAIVAFGLVAGLVVSTQPLYIFLAIAAGAILYCFFTQFEYTVLGLLVLRSALDPFSGYQLTAAFALGLDALTIMYVTLQLLTRQPVHTDRFFWFFAGWVGLQSVWVVLLPLGGLGLGADVLPAAIREWIRLVSWLMVYLLVTQLRDRIHPTRLISFLYASLIIPISIAILQTVIPSVLPPIFLGGSESAPGESISRINGTLGHPNTFATFLLLFIALTCWRLKCSKQRWRWVALLCVLAFFFVSAKSLFSLMMLGVFLLMLLAPSMDAVKFIGGIVLFALVIVLFASTEFGRERLGSIGETPLLNPDIDLWRAILLSAGDGNSFNWRLAQWTDLLTQWRRYPLLGFGLGNSIAVSGNGLLPHNDYIRALIEGGIVGFFTFVFLFIAQFGWLIQCLRSSAIAHNGLRKELCFVLIALLAAVPVGMLTENIWSHTTFFFYWWALFSLVGWDWEPPKNSTSLLTTATSL